MATRYGLTAKERKSKFDSLASMPRKSSRKTVSPAATTFDRSSTALIIKSLLTRWISIATGAPSPKCTRVANSSSFNRREREWFGRTIAIKPTARDGTRSIELSTRPDRTVGEFLLGETRSPRGSGGDGIGRNLQTSAGNIKRNSAESI